MNSFSTFQSQLFRGGLNTNTFSYLNRFSKNIILDPSGGSSYNNLYNLSGSIQHNAFEINNGNTDTFLVLDISSTGIQSTLKTQDFLDNANTECTIYTHYIYNSSVIDNVFSQLFVNPVYNIELSGTTVDNIYHIAEPGQTITIYYLVGGPSPFSYTIRKENDSNFPINAPLNGTYTELQLLLEPDTSPGIIDFGINDNYVQKLYIPFRYEVKVINNLGDNYFQINDQNHPTIIQYPGIHYFDIGDHTNDGYTLSFSLHPDNDNDGSTGTQYMDYVDISGTPGISGSYVRIFIDENTPMLYYYGSNQTTGHVPGMGGALLSLQYYENKYYVKVVQNTLNEYVYAFDLSEDGVYYNQPDISFGGGALYLFNIDDSSNDPYTLQFSTNVDSTPTTSEIAATIYLSGHILLDLSTYDGEPLRYFEELNANMGYVDMPNILETNSAPTNGLTMFYKFNDGDIINNTIKNYVDGNYNTVRIVNNYDTASNQLFIENKTPDTRSYFGIPKSLNQAASFTFSFYITITGWSYDGEDNGYGGIFYIGQENIGTHPFYTVHCALLTKNIYGKGRGVFGNDRGFEHGSSSGHTLETVKTHFIVTYNKDTKTFVIYKDSDILYDKTKDPEVNFMGTVPIDNFSCTHIYFAVGRSSNYTFEAYYDQFRFYDRLLSSTEIDDLVAYDFANPPATYYYVKVVSNQFELSDALSPQVIFDSGQTYIFDQSHESNANEQIVYGETFDNKTSLYTNGVIVVGTPGQPGAYTQIDVPTPSPSTLYYYSYNSNNMGYQP